MMRPAGHTGVRRLSLEGLRLQSLSVVPLRQCFRMRKRTNLCVVGALTLSLLCVPAAAMEAQVVTLPKGRALALYFGRFLQTEKDEYETSADYRRRILRVPLDTLEATLPVACNDAPWRYDADAEVFSRELDSVSFVPRLVCPTLGLKGERPIPAVDLTLEEAKLPSLRVPVPRTTARAAKPFLQTAVRFVVVPDTSSPAIAPSTSRGDIVVKARLLAVGVKHGATGAPLVEWSAVGTNRPSDGGQRPVDDQLYSEDQVEKPAIAMPGSAQPRYPDILRSAGVEGDVLVQFVVDTSGRADLSSFKVLRSTHELFAATVRNTLPNMRFAPAEIGGRKVKQIVQQPFAFAIER